MRGQKLIRFILGLALFCLALSPFPGLAGSRQVRFFYQKVCDSCNPQVEFEETFFRLTGESLDGYEYFAYDADTQPGKQELDKALADYAIDESDIRYPVLIFGGQLYMGQDQIRTDLPAYILKSGANTESFIYYVSVTGCESCMRVDKMLSDLPATVSIKRGDITFPSPVRVKKVNLLTEPGMAMAIFDAFHVEEGSRSAPILLAGDAYWQGEENISAFLKYSLPAGRALGTPNIQLKAKEPFLPSALAGFVGGLYGCLSLFALPFALFTALGAGQKKAAAVFFFLAAAAAAACVFLFMPEAQGTHPFFFAAVCLGSLISSILFLGAARSHVQHQFSCLKSQAGMQYAPPTAK
jgi:hypothetical protein